MTSVASIYPSCEAEHIFKFKAKSEFQRGKSSVSVGSWCFPECCVCLASTVLLNYMHTALHSLGAQSGTPTLISTW